MLCCNICAIPACRQAVQGALRMRSTTPCNSSRQHHRTSWHPALIHTHAHRRLSQNQAQQEAATRPSAAAQDEQRASAEPHNAHVRPAQTAGAATCTLCQHPHKHAHRLPSASAEPDDASSVRVDVDVKEARSRGQARHGHHVAHQGVQEASTHRRTHVTDRQREPARRACAQDRTGSSRQERYTGRRKGLNGCS